MCIPSVCRCLRNGGSCQFEWRGVGHDYCISNHSDFFTDCFISGQSQKKTAFSTIGQLGYIVLGAAIATDRGQGWGVLHIAMHACGKITLFFCAGAIFVATGKKYVSQLRGLGRRMPITMGAFMIGSLSVIGLPPLGGFISKWYLALGALDRDAMWVVVVLLISSLLNVFYLLPVCGNSFFQN